jgi:hypothetical protein
MTSNITNLKTLIMKNLNEILNNSKQYLNQGNFKMASVEVSSGIETCSQWNKQIQEETNLNLSLKDQFLFKQDYMVNGKRIQYWSEKFWTLLEDNNLDLVLKNKPEIEALTSVLLKSKVGSFQEEVEYQY